MDSEADVVLHRHRERGRLLKHHSHLGPQQVDVVRALEQVAAADHDLSRGALPGIQFVDTVQGPQQGGLATAGRANERGDLAVVDVHVHVVQRLVFSVEEAQIADLHLRGNHRRGLLGRDTDRRVQ